jgi:hypothetical protein
MRYEDERKGMSLREYRIYVKRKKKLDVCNRCWSNIMHNKNRLRYYSLKSVHTYKNISYFRRNYVRMTTIIYKNIPILEYDELVLKYLNSDHSKWIMEPRRLADHMTVKSENKRRHRRGCKKYSLTIKERNNYLKMLEGIKDAEEHFQIKEKIPS